MQEEVKEVDRTESERVCCAVCGELIDRRRTHISIVLSEEIKLDDDIVPVDVCALAHYHLECSPYKRANEI
jgi:hypothetical protein